MDKQPETLQEGIIFFASPNNCREYLVARRWPNGVACPRCGSLSVVYQPKHNRWQCASHHDRRQFTLKTGTIFEDSPISLDKWLVTFWLVVNCKNGVSSYEVHRAIGVTQKTAWFMDHRIRLALDLETSEKLSGTAEVDEMFVGGKAKNVPRQARERKITSRGPSGKTIVMGMLERGGKARAAVIPNRDGETLKPIIRQNVEAKAEVFTDARRIQGA